MLLKYVCSVPIISSGTLYVNLCLFNDYINVDVSSTLEASNFPFELFSA